MTFARSLASVTGLFLRITEAGFVLVGFIVLIYILLGAGSGPYVVSVVGNLTGLIAEVGPQSLVGIAIVLALLHLARARAFILLASGKIFFVPSVNNNVTRFVSTAKPASSAEMSFATIRSKRFDSNFSIAFSRRSWLSAAKPTTM